jgi:hypothetical protein
MSIKTKFAAAALAALTVTGGVIATSKDAQAGHRGGHAVGLGIATGVLVGAALAGTYAGAGYRRCHWVRQYDGYGRYAGRVHVCRTYY